MKKVLSIFFLFVISCNTQFANSDFQTKSTTKSIINGSVDTDPARDAVAFLYNEDGYACGSTLITPNILLTAAHCATEYQSTTPLSPSKLTAIFCRDMSDTSTCTQERMREIMEVYVHPYYDANNIKYDLALLRLASPAPGDVYPISPLPSSLGLTGSDAGMQVTFAGYGLTDGYDDQSTSSVRRVFTGTLEGVCHDSGGCSLGSWSSYNIAPYTLYTDQSSGGTCQGDSGGPALINLSGQTYVAGITSYGFENCTGPGVYTEVSHYSNEINSFIDNAPPENCSNNIDDDGDGMTDCDDPECSSNSSCPTNPCLTSQLHYLSCGVSDVYARTVGGTALFSSYSCGGGNESGTESVFKLSMAPGTKATITLTPVDQNLDMFIVTGEQDSCSPNSCKAYSANSSLSDETITYTVNEQYTYLIIDSPVSTSRFYISTTCDFPPENCSNGIDDDGDNKKDCDDPDCANNPLCSSDEHETNCTDNVDNDGDGFTDCDDSDCFQNINCDSNNRETLCADAIDNDGDGLIDCADPDCQQSASNCQSDDDKKSKSGCSTSGQQTGNLFLFFMFFFLSKIYSHKFIKNITNNKTHL